MQIHLRAEAPIPMPSRAVNAPPAGADAPKTNPAGENPPISKPVIAQPPPRNPDPAPAEVPEGKKRKGKKGDG
jgi:hypothetical protein